MLSDFKVALRQLRKSPGFALTAVLTLALGTGATTAIFTLVHAVLLKSLPVTKPEELYRIGDKVHCCRWGGFTQWEEYSLLNYELYKHFRDNTPAFTDLAAFEAGNSSLSVRRMGSEEPSRSANGEYVSGNYFRTFGIGPWAGRVIHESDDREGAAPVAVISYRTWQEKFGGDPSVVGASFLMNSKPFTVIGIAPPGFFGGALKSWGIPEFWIPLADEPVLMGTNSVLKDAKSNWLDVIGRVKPGTDPKALESQLKLELRQWQTGHLADMGPQDKDRMPTQALHLTPGGGGVTQMREEYRDGLRLLLIAAGCVLLIACSNLANLLLARGIAHKQQTSVRMALGASRARMVRKALVESLMLGLLGGVTGLAVAFAGTKMILHLAFSGPNSYVPIEAAPSLPVLLFALGVSVITGVCFGIAPAWVASHSDPVEAMRGANRSTAKKSSLPQKALVAAQAGLSLVLLSAAVMLSQSLRNLEHQSFGFETKDRYIAWMDPALGGYQPEQLPALYERLQQRLERVPGVRQVAFTSYAPMSGDSWNNLIYIAGKPEPSAKDLSDAAFARVTPGMFELLQAKMAMGRSISEEDTASTRKVAMINEAFARKFFKGEDPLGKHFGGGEIKNSGDYEVIGVVKDIRYIISDRESIRPMYYLPEAQTVHQDKPDYLFNLVVWAPGSPAELGAQVRKAFADVDPNMTIGDFKSYDDAIGFDFRQEGLIARLTSLFGGLALVLAAVGIYGVTAYGVEQRINEIGIRMALGADRLSVIRMVLRGAFMQVGVGLLIGIPAAIAAGHAMTAQLFAVQPWNPIILASAAMLLGFAALVAAVIPSQRAASVDPVVALRND